MALHRKGGLRDHVCGELLRDDGARSFSAHEMADPILRGRDDLANPCRRRGPLALDYWIRLPGELWSWSGARSTRIAVDGLRGAQMPQATDRHVVR